MSVHNEYTGYSLKHLLLRHTYNLSLPNLCATLLGAPLLLESTHGITLTLYCAVPYMAACVVVSGTLFWDRSHYRPATMYSGSNNAQCSHRIVIRNKDPTFCRAPTLVADGFGGQAAWSLYELPERSYIQFSSTYPYYQVCRSS